MKKRKQQKLVADSVSMVDHQGSLSILNQLASICFLCFVVFFFVWISVNIYEWKKGPDAFPLTQLIVESKKNSKVSVNEIQQTLAKIGLTGFFNQDVNAIRKVIEQLPWIQSASVHKIWPDTLKVIVKEYQAVTKWNQTELLSADGSIFSANYENLDEQVLIDLQGPDNTSQLVLSTYKNLQQQLKSLDLTIVSLNLNDRHSWSMQLQDGLKIRLGRQDIMQRMARFTQLYPLLHKDDIYEQQREGQQARKISYVDLRYDSGLSVGWEPLTLPATEIN